MKRYYHRCRECGREKPRHEGDTAVRPCINILEDGTRCEGDMTAHEETKGPPKFEKGEA